MPRPTNNPSQQCCGFSGKDNRRCRLNREPGTLVCKIHKHYYDGWWSGRKVTHLSVRQERELEFQLKNGYIDIPKSLLSQLEQFPHHHIEYAPFFRIVVGSSNVLPTDYPELTYAMLHRTFQDVLNYTTGEISMDNYKTIVPYCKTADSCWLVLLVAGTWIINTNYHAWVVQSSLTFLMQLFHGFLVSVPELRCLGFSDRLHSYAKDLCVFYKTHYQVTTPDVHATVDFLCAHLQTHLLITMKAFMEEQKARCNTFKEELIANRFHPSRIEALIEQFGIDYLENL